MSVLKQGNVDLKKLKNEANTEKLIIIMKWNKGIIENNKELDNELDKLLDNIQKEKGKIDLLMQIKNLFIKKKIKMKKLKIKVLYWKYKQ